MSNSVSKGLPTYYHNEKCRSPLCCFKINLWLNSKGWILRIPYSWHTRRIYRILKPFWNDLLQSQKRRGQMANHYPAYVAAAFCLLLYSWKSHSIYHRAPKPQPCMSDVRKRDYLKMQDLISSSEERVGYSCTLRVVALVVAIFKFFVKATPWGFSHSMLKIWFWKFKCVYEKMFCCDVDNFAREISIFVGH